jgi:hypothetical protein
VGANVGFAVGGGLDVPIITEVKAMVTVDTSFHKGWENSVTTSVYIGDSIGTGEDVVIFSAQAYDVYYYEIADSTIRRADGSIPPILEAGQPFSIAIPRGIPEIRRLEKNLYNEWIQNSIDAGLPNAEENYKIPTGDDTNDTVVAKAKLLGLDHKLGEPFTYPDSTDKNAIQTEVGTDGLFLPTDKMRQVGSGTDTGYITYNLSSEIGNGVEWDWSLAIGAKVEASGGFFGGVATEAYANVEYTGNTSTSFSSATVIEGAIPDIGLNYAGDSSKSLFKVGLMAYPVADKNQRYAVVTYWVTPSN